MNATSGTAPPKGRGDPFGLVGARLDSRYEVGELVAQGGFGVVYRAQHRELRKPVAIKVLKTPADFTPKQQADFLRRFQEEARTVAQLDHPHIVRVLDFGTSIMPSGARAPWMALEWLEGVTLESDFDARIQTGSGGRSPSECAALMFPVIEAVGVAHDEGVIHRDIKPSNLMIVAGRRGDPRLKLLDFGIAKVMAPEERRAADRAQTLTQVQAFSPDYAAPEQVSGTRTGPWTDVHSLALLMSEMLSAAVPFEGADTMEMCANVLAPKRPTPGRFGVDVGPWEPVLAKALSLDPSSRYANASEFLIALMDNLPPGVSPAQVQYRISQTGAHRPTPTPNIPTPADGISPLSGARVEQLAPTARPPSMLDLGRAPTLLAASSPPSQEHFEPAAESEVDEPELHSGPTSPPPSPGSPSFLPPSLQHGIPTEPIARPRSFVAPLLVLIGLFFGGLVASAVVLLLRPAPAVVRRTNHPLASPPSLVPPAVVAVAPAPVVPAAPVRVDASAAVPAIVDASAVDAPSLVDASAVDESPRHRSSRHRSRHGHRHHHHRSRVPAE